MTTNPPLLRLLLWPSLITMAISFLRLFGEKNEWFSPQSGGAFHPLGIVWCAFVFGGWFGKRLAAAGAGPRVGKPALASTLLFVAMIAGMVASVMLTSGNPRDLPNTPEGQAVLRTSVLTVATTAAVVMLGSFVVWPALARTLLVYGLFERGVVVAITWLAKVQGWNTHYTKFGPNGFEYDLERTVTSASIAQFGVWVPFTVLAGGMVGSWFARRRG